MHDNVETYYRAGKKNARRPENAQPLVIAAADGASGVRSTNNLRQDKSGKLWPGKQIFAPGAPTHQPSQICTDVIGA